MFCAYNFHRDSSIQGVMKMNYETGKNMKDCTTLKIGGPAERFYTPENPEQIREILLEAKKEGAPVCLLGNGSNVLFEDDGYDGWIIQTAENLKDIRLLDDNRVFVEAGVTNEELSDFLASHNLGGYEFASGIPGTVGGAVIMNAGAYGGEICDVIESADWMDENGEIHTVKAEDMDLSYRHSMFTDRFGIVLSAVFKLDPKPESEIREKMDDLHEKRWSKQPMEDASAGSTFKRPKEGYASALIHECGLQGLSVGDAEVSKKHAGFLINAGNASCKEFLSLVSLVKQKVREQKGIDLELEVHLIPKSGR